MKKIKEDMTDKERILMALVSKLASTQLLAFPGISWGRERFVKTYAGSTDVYTHFAYWEKPKAGDLVLAKTGGVSPWKVGWYVEPIAGNFGGAVIREIGTGKLCNYGNEDFVPIVGMNKSTLLEGEDYQFYCKVLAAFQKGDEYRYRFGGVDFESDTAVIWIREVFGGVIKNGEQGSKPFSISMKFNKRTSVKAILKAMRDGGYGTRKFEPVEAEKAGNKMATPEKA